MGVIKAEQLWVVVSRLICHAEMSFQDSELIHSISQIQKSRALKKCLDYCFQVIPGFEVKFSLNIHFADQILQGICVQMWSKTVILKLIFLMKEFGWCSVRVAHAQCS